MSSLFTLNAHTQLFLVAIKSVSKRYRHREKRKKPEIGGKYPKLPLDKFIKVWYTLYKYGENALERTILVREILTVPNSLLLKKSKIVGNVLAPDIQSIIKDMIDTLNARPDGAGLAAPQIGISKRIFVGINPDSAEIEVFINPRYIYFVEGKIADWEGCLSIPGKIGIVKRYPHVVIQYTDEKGEEQQKMAEGFFARLIQHEMDHLNGILYISKATVVKDVEISEEGIMNG